MALLLVASCSARPDAQALEDALARNANLEDQVRAAEARAADAEGDSTTLRSELEGTQRAIEEATETIRDLTEERDHLKSFVVGATEEQLNRYPMWLGGNEIPVGQPFVYDVILTGCGARYLFFYDTYWLSRDDIFDHENYPSGWLVEWVPFHSGVAAVLRGLIEYDGQTISIRTVWNEAVASYSRTPEAHQACED